MHKVFFFHCPKAGGTSLRKALERDTPQNLISPIIENDSAGHKAQSNYDGFRGYHLYMGPYGKDIFDQVNDGHVTITNFRHPASRIVSLYNFFRDQVTMSPEMLNEETYYAVKFAKENDFQAFITSDDLKLTVYTRNQHVRQLTRSPWENGPGDLDQAQRLVRDMPCYYVCEYPDLSALWLRERLGLKDLPYENKTNETDQSIRVAGLDPGTIEEICRINSEDLQALPLRGGLVPDDKDGPRWRHLGRDGVAFVEAQPKLLGIQAKVW